VATELQGRRGVYQARGTRSRAAHAPGCQTLFLPGDSQLPKAVSLSPQPLHLLTSISKTPLPPPSLSPLLHQTAASRCHGQRTHSRTASLFSSSKGSFRDQLNSRYLAPSVPLPTRVGRRKVNKSCFAQSLIVSTV
jgi:hypothetical protein